MPNHTSMLSTMATAMGWCFKLDQKAVSKIVRSFRPYQDTFSDHIFLLDIISSIPVLILVRGHTHNPGIYWRTRNWGPGKSWQPPACLSPALRFSWSRIAARQPPTSSWADFPCCYELNIIFIPVTKQILSFRSWYFGVTHCTGFPSQSSGIQYVLKLDRNEWTLLFSVQ